MRKILMFVFSLISLFGRTAYQKVTGKWHARAAIAPWWSNLLVGHIKL